MILKNHNKENKEKVRFIEIKLIVYTYIFLAEFTNFH